ncbi:hypothetical protein PYCCODRAFT_1469928 [Trametes coccinea BRFM310]|uniref:Uncharacterized protein n=1 Tax=Trametes coccinea (strain BRFM310) TaxID=1353009 RepID=A0A1Y2IFC6_TRAC3|nr:hypothetical protein PYCCODRAFT_1469928 [Trametes coccinea BRFM310]
MTKGKEEDQAERVDQENQEVEEDLREEDPADQSGQAGPKNQSKVKEPDVFTGDHNKANEFLADLYLLFHSWPNDYPNEATQRLNEEGQPRGFGTWRHFREDFLLVFGEQDPVQTTAAQLAALRYDSRKPLDRFNAKSLHLFIKGHITEDHAQMAWYNSKLAGFLHDKIALTYPQPTNMDELMDHAIHINWAYLRN